MKKDNNDAPQMKPSEIRDNFTRARQLFASAAQTLKSTEDQGQKKTPKP